MHNKIQLTYRVVRSAHNAILQLHNGSNTPIVEIPYHDRLTEAIQLALTQFLPNQIASPIEISIQDIRGAKKEVIASSTRNGRNYFDILADDPAQALENLALQNDWCEALAQRFMKRYELSPQTEHYAAYELLQQISCAQGAEQRQLLDNYKAIKLKPSKIPPVEDNQVI